ncbi:DUF4097 family beta strand repeat-containing protein [Herbidospora sp. RD11066]
MQKFATTQPITADLDVPMGLVRLVATDRTDAIVDVRPTDPNSSADVKAAGQTTVEFTGGVLKVKSPEGPRFGRSGSVEVVVEVPSGSAVDGRGLATGFRTEGRFAATTIRTAQGDVALGTTDGPVVVRIEKGDVRVAEAVRGQLELTTLSGKVEVGVAEGVGAGLMVSTGYGNLTNHLKKIDGPAAVDITASTSHGDVIVRSN